MDQLALFDSTPAMPAGFTYRPNMLSAAEEAKLVAQLSALPFQAFEFHGYTGQIIGVSLVSMCSTDRRAVSGNTVFPASMRSGIPSPSGT